MNLGKWVVIALVVMVCAAILGFLVKAVQWIAGLVFLIALVVLGVQLVGKRFGGKG